MGAQQDTARPPDAGALEFDHFHSSAEVEAAFAALAQAYPRWFRTGSLGESVQGRPMPYLEVADAESPVHRAEGRGKAMWIDGAIHGHELGSAEPVLGVAESLRCAIALGEPPSFLEDITLYLVPVINVDARRVSLFPPGLRQRLNLAPVDDDGDGRADEDGPADLNGDGRIAMIPIMRPDGRIGRRFESRDQDGDGRCGEDPPGGYDLNRNFPVARTPGDIEGGPLQPETAAVMEFWRQHPEIELAVSYHTSTNAFVLPPVPIPDADRERFEPFIELYRSASGAKELVLPPAQLRGLSIEWFYTEHKAVALIIEIARDGPELERAADGFEHPCLGWVEIPRIESGWMFAGQTHLERHLPEVVDLHVDYLLAMAARLAAGEDDGDVADSAVK